MTSPKDLRYTKTHEWVRVEGDIATIGITDYAQNELGDITYLELPEVGSQVTQNEPLGVIESVKAASDVYAPVSGEVIERNEQAIESPDLVNRSPYDEAWLVKVRMSNPSELESLMNADEYDAFAAEAVH
ncbi:MAG: glycine cleavage system protein H [Chloroflexota bacterium]